MAGEVQHLRRLVDDLFELALLDAGASHLAPEVTPLQSLVLGATEAMQAQAEKRRVALRMEADCDELRLPVDAARVQRVLLNLIENAIEHTPDDGTFVVRVADAGEQARVEVSDSGPGIPPELLPNVWERFYRTDPSRQRLSSHAHAGLGLAIARGFVEAHGGSVSVVSKPGTGSTFAFTLPKRPPVRPAEPAAATP
jgi:signal transduction histidine kinase